MKELFSVRWMGLFVFSGLGFTIILIGLRLIYKRFNLYWKGVKTIGTVVGVSNHVNDENGGRYSTPIVEFQTFDGKTQKLESDFVDTHNKYPVGAEAIVIYNPRKPFDAEIKDFLTFAWMPFVIMVFGCWFLALGIFGYLDEAAL